MPQPDHQQRAYPQPVVGVAKAWQEFDDDGRMTPSPYYDRVLDVMEELVKFMLLTRGRLDYLVDRYSERKGDEIAAALVRAAGAAAR